MAFLNELKNFFKLKEQPIFLTCAVNKYPT